MAVKDVIVKITSTIQSYASANTGNRYPDPVEQSFTAQERVENQVQNIAASGTLTITAASLGITQAAFFKMECLTAGKTVNIAFNADLNGVNLIPYSTTSTVFLEGNTAFTSATITNPDTVNAITIQYSIFEKSPTA